MISRANPDSFQRNDMHSHAAYDQTIVTARAA